MPGKGPFLDGVGIDFLWGEITGYVDENVAGVASFLPIPQIEISGTTVKIANSYSAYGSGVTVRYRSGSEPSETDATVDLASGVSLSSGTYYFRAFPEAGSAYKASASAKATI